MSKFGYTLPDYDHFPRNSEELKKRKEIFTILFDAKAERCDSDMNLSYMRNTKWIAKRIDIVKMLLRRSDIDVNALSFEKFSPLDMAEVWLPQLPPSIKTALKEKGAVLNVFRQTETQSPSRFHLDVRCRVALQRLLCNVFGHIALGTRNSCKEDLPGDLLEKRLLSLIEAFQDQIVSGKDKQGRTALHLVAISFYSMWAVYEGGKSYPKNLANTIVKELINIGCNVNETDIYGRTPLHYANVDLKNLLICYRADKSIKDKDGNSAIDEIPNQFSTESSDIVKAVINREDETYFLRPMNNKQMEIEVQCVDSKIRANNDRELWPKTVPRLLWEKGEFAFLHPLVKQITKEVIFLMDTIAKEIERLDPRFEIRPEFVGSSNEGTKIDKPGEFDFCVVLTKISELCEISQSPELPTGFVRLKRKIIKVGETRLSDFDSFFGKDGILNTEKLKCQFKTIFSNAIVNIESQQNLDWILELSNRSFMDAPKKIANICLIKPINLSSVSRISIDIVPCIHVDGWWPDEAISNVSDEIKNFGCNLIFDRPQKLYPWVPYSESCARVSFAKAESDMIMQSCDNAREAYMIGKTMIEKPVSYEVVSPKYPLKNCLLYCIEALTPTSEKASQLGLCLEEMNYKFSQMDRYLWLKCLMKCHLEFVSQDFCPCYFLPNFSSPIFIVHGGVILITDNDREYRSHFPKLCRKSYALYRCTSTDTSESCYQSPAPDLLWERFDRNQLIASLCEIAYK